MLPLVVSLVEIDSDKVEDLVLDIDIEAEDDTVVLILDLRVVEAVVEAVVVLLALALVDFVMLPEVVALAVHSGGHESPGSGTAGRTRMRLEVHHGAAN